MLAIVLVRVIIIMVKGNNGEALIVFTDHARQQLKERNISESRVIMCLRKPEKIVREQGIRFRALKTIRTNSRHRLLVVAYDEGGQMKKVVTAFITSKIKKYL